MANAHAALPEQFDDLPQQREASTLGMWTFLATEVLFFGGMFLAYITYRHSYPQAFAQASHHTLVWYGTINTAILLTSSLTMALGVYAAGQGNQRWLLRCLLLTVLLGLSFLVVKGFEYREDISEQLWPGPHFRADLPPASQMFWILYWLMTGVHALHVTVGVGAISTIAWMAHRGRFSPAYYIPVEMTGLYWHFVDVVWIFLYPLLYLVQRYSA